MNFKEEWYEVLNLLELKPQEFTYCQFLENGFINSKATIAELKCCGNCSHIQQEASSLVCDIKFGKKCHFYNFCEYWEFNNLSEKERELK